MHTIRRLILAFLPALALQTSWAPAQQIQLDEFPPPANAPDAPPRPQPGLRARWRIGGVRGGRELVKLDLLRGGPRGLQRKGGKERQYQSSDRVHGATPRP